MTSLTHVRRDVNWKTILMEDIISIGTCAIHRDMGRVLFIGTWCEREYHVGYHIHWDVTSVGRRCGVLQCVVVCVAVCCSVGCNTNWEKMWRIEKNQCRYTCSMLM